MAAIAVGYAQLNRADPDCGTVFTWAARAIGPRTGWMGGWVATLASVIAMAYLAGIAGSYLFLLFGADGIAAGHTWTTVAGVAIVLVMTYVCYRGIQLSARLQYVLFGLEAALLVIFSVVALVKVYTGHAPAGHLHPALTWFSPLGNGGTQAFTTGLLLALFIYWGWDSAVSVNEETSDRRRNPGRAAIFSTVVLLGLYMLVSVAAQAYGGVGTKGLGLANLATAPDVLAHLGQSVLGGALNKLLVLATLSSAIGALQTGILPTARTTLAMATYGALPASFARIDRRFATPSVSTLAIGGLTALIFAVLTYVSHGRIQADSILSIGLLIAFYYGMVGYTCAWQFRRELRRPCPNGVGYEPAGTRHLVHVNGNACLNVTPRSRGHGEEISCQASPPRRALGTIWGPHAMQRDLMLGLLEQAGVAVSHRAAHTGNQRWPRPTRCRSPSAIALYG